MGERDTEATGEATAGTAANWRPTPGAECLFPNGLGWSEGKILSVAAGFAVIEFAPAGREDRRRTVRRRIELLREPS